MLDYVEYLADLLIAAELEQRVKIVEMLDKDDLIARFGGTAGTTLEEEEHPMKKKQSA